MTYTEWLTYLTARGEMQVSLGLERMQAACARCDNPHLAVPTVHIAGTNGKGSTGAMLVALARSAGLHVGHYTSPHLRDFTERIAVNGQPTTPDACAAAASWCVSRVADIPLSYFELATLIGFRVFANITPRLDMAIIETGLGGRLDATNVVRPIGVMLTPIAQDHEQWLGHSLTAIAREKCGIIKPNVPVVSAPQSPDVATVIEATCAAQHAPLQWADALPSNTPVALPGAHQRVNASVAWALAQQLMQHGWPLMSCAAFATAQWRGRCEWLRHDPPVLFDGAHNPHGMHALAAYVASIRQARRVIVALACMADKDIAQMLTPWRDLAHEVLAIPLVHPRAQSAADTQHSAQQLGFSSHVATLEAALSHQPPDTMLVMCGSLYLYAPACAALHR